MTDLLTSNGWVAYGAIVILQATLLLSAAALAAWALRRRPAAERHLVWGIAVAGAVALPLLGAAAPWHLSVSVPGWAQAETEVTEWNPAHEIADVTDDAVALIAGRQSSPRLDTGGMSASLATAPSTASVVTTPWNAGRVLLWIWLSGLAGVGAFTLLAVTHLRLVARRARELRDQGLVERTRRIGLELGIKRRVRLLEGDADAMPMTFGVLRPTLLLPSTARSWAPDRQDSVLRHELAHIRRRDTLTQLVADVGCALYWFHPLMWLAARRLRIEREHACDDVVLASGQRPSEYAGALLEIARTMRTRRLTAPVAIAMAQPTRLRGRITAVLDDRSRAERVQGRLLVPCWIGALALTTAFAVITPVPAGQASPIVTVIGNHQSPDRITEMPSPLSGQDAMSAMVTEPADRANGELSVGDVTLSTDEPTCWHDRHAFVGSMYHVDGKDGDVTLHLIQSGSNGLDVCFRTEYAQQFTEGDIQFEIMRPGDRRVLASRTADGRQTLEIVHTATGIEHAWFVDGVERPFDETARQWRDAMLELGAGHHAMDRIRGEAGRLRGEIGRIRGEQGRLRGEIGRIRGEEGRMRGEIGRIRGDEGRVRGEIGRIRGEEGRLRGEVGRLRGQIASLEGARRATSDQQTRNRLDAEVASLRAEMDQAQARIAEFDAEGRVREIERSASSDTQARIREIERRIEAFDAERQIREIEARMAAEDRSGEVAEIERRIESLQIDQRIRQIRDRLEPVERRLLEIQRRIR